MMELTNENYHSVEARMAYMGSSQFKDFMKCESCALVKCKGEVDEKKTTALLVGSYVDAYFSNEMKEFIANTPELFKKDGTLKSDFSKADDIIKSIEEDEMMMKYLGGEHQVIMTGSIAGVPFKIKIDSYFPDKLIVDQKVMASLSPVWDDEERVWKNFVDAFQYQIQGAIYREIVYQNTGKKLPFVLAVATKEEICDKALLQIDDEDLDEALELVKELAPRFQAIKEGKIKPSSCGKCNYCKGNKKVTGIFSYHSLDPYRDED